MFFSNNLGYAGSRLGRSIIQTESPEVFQLGVNWKLQLLEDLWESISAALTQVTIHDWQIEELRKRKQRRLENLGSASSWEDAKAKILKADV